MRNKDPEKAVDIPPQHENEETMAQQSALETGEVTVIRKIILAGVMMLTTFIAWVQSATIASSLLIIPASSIDLGITELQAQWISSAYSLANGCGLLFFGRLADLYGRKYLYLLGMGLYTVFSIISGFVRQSTALCVIRALTGLSLSIALPAAFGIVGVTFHSEPSRTIAFASLALGYPVGAGPGQVIAGLIAGTGIKSWQYLFLILSGLAAFPCLIGIFIIPPEPTRATSTPTSDGKHFDYLGAGLITSSLALFGFGLTQSDLIDGGWSVPYIGICVGISIVLLTLFLYWQKQIDNKHPSIAPLLNLAIFSRQEYKVTAVLCITFTAYMSIAGWMYLTTIFFQTLLHESPLLNALHVLPAPIIGIFACLLVPLLAPKVPAPYLLVLGGCCTAIAQLLFAVVPLGRSWWVNGFLSNLFNPFGADFTVGIGSILLSNLVNDDEQSIVGALFQTAIQLSSTLGVCLCSLTQKLVMDNTASLERGLRVAFWLMAGISWSSALIAGITMREVGLAQDIRES
ncbi:uncharacterized protein L199_006268 [Kwoniella botswanensis]|uniref:uncharacterized protein n=1 Tax=Kwoniella botswanensis TaxID=1268659 RepID=UPI00315CE147